MLLVKINQHGVNEVLTDHGVSAHLNTYVTS